MSQIEINKEGFKLSYQRYLSDGVTGLIFISFFVIAFIKKWELPFVGDSWLTIFPKQIGTEIQIAFLIALFIILPSVGLTLNAVSWFLLGMPLVRSVWIWHKLPKVKWVGPPFRLLTEATNRSYDTQSLIIFFNVDNSSPSSNVEETTVSENLYDVSNYYEHLLIFYFPAYFASQMEYVQGSRRLFRTISTLFFALVLYFWFVHYNLSVSLLCMFVALIFFFLASFIEYYQAMKMLFMVYSLILDRVEESESPNKKKIAQLLAESRIRLSNNE